jgi:uncharacterized SAM-binding protein YcdF (DUF218 family)
MRRTGTVRRSRRIVLVLVVVLVLAWAGAGYRLYVRPRVDPVSAQVPADAVLALGGDVRGAWDAYRLVRTGAARTLVLSNPYHDPSPIAALCDDASTQVPLPPPGRAPDPVPVPIQIPVPTICFVPAPSTTQGEAQELGRLAEARGWQHVIVMAPAFHLSRARMIVGRCYDGELAMVPYPERYPLALWAYEFAYQTGGFAKALMVKRGC